MSYVSSRMHLPRVRTNRTETYALEELRVEERPNGTRQWKWVQLFTGSYVKCLRAWLGLRRTGCPGARVVYDRERGVVKHFDRRTPPHVVQRARKQRTTTRADRHRRRLATV